MAQKHTYQKGSGRMLLRDGRPVMQMRREVVSGVAEMSPSECDDLASEIVSALNGERLYQVLRSKNDPNGNPQRITMVYNGRTGDVLAALDHGYQGEQIPRGAVQLPGFDISRSEYHATLRQWKDETRAYLAMVRS